MTRTTIPLDEGVCRRMLGDPDTPAFVLLTIAMWALGDAVLGDPDGDVDAEDPVELWASLQERFGVWTSEEGENKLNALIMAMQGDLFYRDVDVFTAVATALPDGDLGDLINGGFADLTLADIWWAILEVDIATGRDASTRPEFSAGILDIIRRETAEAQEDTTEIQVAVSESFGALLDNLAELGIPGPVIRLLDDRNDPDENPVLPVS